MAEHTGLQWPDFLVIVVYFVAVIAVGLWSSFRSRRDSVSGYFLASRNMNWLLVGASLFSSNIGSGHFIGLAGSGAVSGIGIATFELSAIFVLMLLGWLFVPVYMAAGVYTMPEYLKLRFGGNRISIYLSVLTLLLYVFTKISADLYAGALFINKALQFGLSGDADLYVSIFILLILAALFTITGGLTAVIWTDTVQTFLMVIGAFVLMARAFVATGGYENLITSYLNLNSTVVSLGDRNETCGAIPRDAMNLFRSAVPGESDLPWTGVIFGMTISSIWYWCSDQVIVQRTLASKSMVHAKGGCIMAGYLKLLPMFLLVLPGMAARVLFPDTVGCSDPKKCVEVCGSESGCSNIAYVELVINLMPPGLSGMMLAVMLAALMSSLSSIFNSSSTIFSLDIWTRIRKNPSDTELLIVGRLSVLALLVISIIWVPIIQSSNDSQLFVYIQVISSFLAPPVCAIYILGIFWARTNEQGAFWGLMVGLGAGLIRFGMEYSYTIPACGTGLPDPRPDFIKYVVGQVHYLHFAILLFAITILAAVIISLLTPPIEEEHLYRLTFWTKDSNKVRSDLGTSESTDTLDTIKDEVLDETKIAPENKSCWRKVINFACGVNQSTDGTVVPAKSKEELAQDAANFLHEPPKWRRLVNGNAMLLMVLAAFMWGYFA